MPGLRLARSFVLPWFLLTARFEGFGTSSVGYHFLPSIAGALKLRSSRRLPPAASTAALPDALSLIHI